MNRLQYFNYFLLSICLIFFLLCIKNCLDQIEYKKTHFKWLIGLSAPKYYKAENSVVIFFNKKKNIGTNSLKYIGEDENWGFGNVNSHNQYFEIPDSIAVSWICPIDSIEYKGSSKLPREKMIKLFKKGYIDKYNKNDKYYAIIVGMTPSGNVTIWMRGRETNTEILKFKANNKIILPLKKKKKKEIKDNEFINSESNTYRYLHGVPYKVWETGEKEYNYEIFFLNNVNSAIKSSITNIYSEDGTIIQFLNTGSIYSIDKINKLESIPIVNNNLLKTAKLPVQLDLIWEKNDFNIYSNFRSKIVLPKNFPTYFDDTFNAIILTAEANDLGKIYVKNSKGIHEVMKFKFDEYKEAEHQVLYSLPKGFQFPKWEGRVPIEKPTNFKYWQED